MMLALANVHPMLAGEHADVHPVARELPRLLRTPADPGDQSGHSVTAQECLQAIDLADVYRAFWQDDGIDGVDLVEGCDEHPVHEVEIELFGRREFEEAERLVGKLGQWPRHRAEV